ncbi:MAG: hypothetical protein J0J10_17955 [Bosea sp.]|uniref:hypothetical protein n=1 Tax=Bosea sp. (in: a-proteobacteria) TaxID=1871050 RepID=UPI001AC70380|nr:hypothetical protein [Bosea sp. (in: a-proteobacteria)]MBN9470653.1 hypothetical protein [Bosea sp. (in: a-proteobacteria)]
MSLNRRTLFVGAASCAVAPALPVAVTATQVSAPVAVQSMTDTEQLARFRYLFGLFDEDGQRAVTNLLSKMLEAQEVEEARS